MSGEKSYGGGSKNPTRCEKGMNSIPKTKKRGGGCATEQDAVRNMVGEGHIALGQGV